MTSYHQSDSIEQGVKKRHGHNYPSPDQLVPFDLRSLDMMTIGDILELGCIEREDPLTIILALMLTAVHEGSLCLEITGEHLDRLVSPSDIPQINARIDQFSTRLKNNHYDHLIARQPSDRFPLVLETITGTDRLYFQKYYLYEKKLRQHLQSFLSIDMPHPINHQTVDAVIDDMYAENHCLRLAKDGPPLSKDPYQVAAVRMALQNQFSIISGGPGTGKTSVMVNILRGLARIGVNPKRIALAAPTGRAAQRMTEAVNKLMTTILALSDTDHPLIELTGRTIHRWLQYRRDYHDFYYNAGNPLPVEALIIDEVSMVDVVMLAKCLDAVNPARTRLILLGDKDQLPSVEAGAVFAEMIPRSRQKTVFENHLVILKKAYRSGSAIQQLASAINAGDIPSYRPISLAAAIKTEPDQWSVVAPVAFEKWLIDLRYWTAHYFLSSSTEYIDNIRKAETLENQQMVENKEGKALLHQLFQHAQQTKILTLLRRGPTGCDTVNSIIAHYLTSQCHTDIDPATGTFSGQIIMVTANDYSKGLYNGDIGVVIGHRGSGFRAYFQHGDRYQAETITSLPAWEPAFAVTVHKSQGSEFGDVLLVLPDDPDHRLLCAEILYTGITRARKKVIIYGSHAALQSGVSRKMVRRSGLVWDGQPTG